ncbi:MAG: hypothetical protein ACUVRD_03355 [Bacteroidia bacterium]
MLWVWGQEASPELIRCWEAYQAKNYARVYTHTEKILADENLQKEHGMAYYLRGLAQYGEGYPEKALRSLESAARRLPSSHPLQDEISYHKAYFYFESRARWADGLYVLFRLLEKADVSLNLRSEAEKLLMHFLYERADIGFLWNYVFYTASPFVDRVYKALLFRLQQGCYDTLWMLAHQAYQRQCGDTLLEPRYVPRDSMILEDTFRLAVLLPFRAGEQRENVAFQLLQGMEAALEVVQTPFAVWHVGVYDTQRDTQYAYGALNFVNAFKPHLVIGEISYSFNQKLRRLGFASAQVVPVNAAAPEGDCLTTTHLSAGCHAQAIARYLLDSMGANPTEIQLIYDASNPIGQAWEANLAKHFYPMTVRLSYSKSNAVSQLRQMPKEMWRKSFLLVPTTSEDHVNIVLVEALRESFSGVIVGHSSWLEFPRTYLQDFARSGLRIWIPVEGRWDTLAWQDFRRYFRGRYGVPPSRYHIEGWDIIHWIAEGLKQGEYKCPTKQPYRGISDYYQAGCEPRNRLQLIEIGPVSRRLIYVF